MKHIDENHKCPGECLVKRNGKYHRIWIIHPINCPVGLGFQDFISYAKKYHKHKSFKKSKGLKNKKNDKLM